MPNKALVVDPNILVRAVLGKRARKVIETYAESVSFFVPEAAYAEAEEHLATLVIQRGGDPKKARVFCPFPVALPPCSKPSIWHAALDYG